MATTLKKTMSGLVMLALALTLLNSCNDGPGKDGVWIPNPKDSSALAKINHFIPLGELNKFREQFTVVRDSLARTNPNLFIPISETFNKKILLDILKDPRNVGIRVYYGVKKGEKRDEFRLLLVGVDANGKDLYIEEGSPAAAKAPGGRAGGGEYGQCNPPCNPPQQ